MVSLFAFTCFAVESQKSMTYEAVGSICIHADEAGVDCDPMVYNQVRNNKGFAFGMNKALKMADKEHDYYMCFNNDIDFEKNPGWLKHLLAACDGEHVLTPTTNYTGCNEQRADGPSDKPHFDHGDTPAILWMFPGKIMKAMQADDGLLFREDLGRAWGEDTYAAAKIRKICGPRPFRIVPKAWVRHHGALTSSQIPVSERMGAVKKARRLIIEHGLDGV